MSHLTFSLASFPGPAQLSVTCSQALLSFPSLVPRPCPAFRHLQSHFTILKAMESMVGPGNEATSSLLFTLMVVLPTASTELPLYTVQ